MPSGRLSPLQERVPVLLAGLEPPWNLTGGGALAGFHLGHRTTRGLDLFWHGREELGSLTKDVPRVLRDAGLEVGAVQSSTAFERLRVSDEKEEVILDLVAESVRPIEPPAEVAVAGTRIRIDTAHEILVNKLCAILERKELRALVDLRALVAQGGELELALADAPRKDGGFSPLLVAWLLREIPVRELAPAAQLTPAEAEELARFRDELVQHLTRASRPE